MPYTVSEDTQACPINKPWAVKQEDTEKVVGCHATEADAKKQQQTLLAKEEGDDPVKEQPNGKKKPTDKPDAPEDKPKPTSTPPKGTEEKPKKKPPTKTDGGQAPKKKPFGQPGDDEAPTKKPSPAGKKPLVQDEEDPEKKKKKKKLEKKSVGLRENLVRSMTRASGLHEDNEGRILFGHFARFNEWTQINSWVEGNFMERIAPGAFQRAIERGAGRVKVLFDHGYDPQLGNKPLGPIRALEEDEEGVYYEVELLDTSYNNDFIIPAARSGVLGASFRFSIPEGGDEWREPKERSAHNPNRLPERTIHDLELYEFGPVTFPAYEGATSGVRSETDSFVEQLLRNPRFVARFTERVGLGVVEKTLDELEDNGTEMVSSDWDSSDELESAGQSTIRSDYDESVDDHSNLDDERKSYAQYGKTFREQYVRLHRIGKFTS